MPEPVVQVSLRGSNQQLEDSCLPTAAVHGILGAPEWRGYTDMNVARQA
jgi:hypothetical protein